MLAGSMLLLVETLSFGFMSDDFVMVYRIREDGFFTSWGGSAGEGFFRPVSVAVFWLDNVFWGLNSVGYHFTNLLWHLFSSLMVFFVADELFSSRLKGFLSGILFLLLACHTESVTWVAGRTDLIAGGLGLFSVLLFLRRSSLSLVAFLLALLAKESTIIIPGVWMLMLVMRNYRDRFRWRIVFAGFALSGAFLAFRLISGNVAADLSSAGGSLSTGSIFQNLLRYAFRVFIPPLPDVFRSSVESHPHIIAMAFISFISVLIYLYLKRNGPGRVMLFSGCFMISLLPVLFMAVSIMDTRSERFLYFPSAFAVLGLVEWSFSVLHRRQASVLLLVFVLLQGGFFYLSNRNWKRAGEICREVISGETEDVPEYYNGAYVFLNGYEEAMLLRGR